MNNPPVCFQEASGWVSTECEQRLNTSPLHPHVPRLIIDIAASSVAHYGPVEMLRVAASVRASLALGSALREWCRALDRRSRCEMPVVPC